MNPDELQQKGIAELSREQQFARDYLIFKCISGSRAYNTATPESDFDHRAIFIAPPEYTIGCLKSVEQVEVAGEDTVIYELAKFVQLAAQSNPNIIELLYVDSQHIVFSDPSYEKLRANRHLFLSKKAKHSFSGYAYAQLKRIKGHHKWIQNPQEVEPPKLIEFMTFINEIGHIQKPIPESLLEGAFLVPVNATTFRVFTCPTFSKPMCSDLMLIICEIFAMGSILMMKSLLRLKH